MRKPTPKIRVWCSTNTLSKYITKSYLLLFFPEVTSFFLKLTYQKKLSRVFCQALLPSFNTSKMSGSVLSSIAAVIQHTTFVGNLRLP